MQRNLAELERDAMSRRAGGEERKLICNEVRLRTLRASRPSSVRHDQTTHEQEQQPWALSRQNHWLHRGEYKCLLHDNTRIALRLSPIQFGQALNIDTDYWGLIDFAEARKASQFAADEFAIRDFIKIRIQFQIGSRNGITFAEGSCM